MRRRRRGTWVAALVGLALACTAGPAYAAPITVTTLTAQGPNPDGNCTLREALIAANENSGEDACAAGEALDTDTIGFAVNGTIALSTLTGGDLDVEPDTAAGPLVIDGNGAGTTVISGGNEDRVINLLGTGTIDLTIRDLTIRNGKTASHGGGIAGLLGGQVLKLRVEDSVVDSNEAGDNTGGGGIAVLAGLGSELDVVESTVSTNMATDATNGAGAGIVAFGTVDVTIDHSTISGNINSGPYGGGLSIQQNSVLTVENGSRISSNQAGQGAGIYWAPTTPSTTKIVVRDSEVRGNGATGVGGGIDHANADHGEIELDGATIAGNTASSGAGLETSSLKALNTTISGNTATGAFGGGVELTADGTPGRGLAEIRSSTIADNAANLEGDAIALVNAAATLTGTVVSDSESLTDGDPNDACYVGFPPTSTIGPGGGANIDDGDSCGFGATLGNLEDTDAQLGELADNGGPVRTMALAQGSPAVGLLPAGDCDVLGGASSLGEDARGYPRPTSGACDSGAYELFTCDGAPLNAPGPFAGCPAPPSPSTVGISLPPAIPAVRKRCGKKRVLKRGRCVKKKKKRKK